MYLKFKSFRSGSSGNFYIVQSPETTIVVDPGLPTQKGIREGLDLLGGSPPVLALVSHTHSDHLSYAALRVLEEREIPVYVPRGQVYTAVAPYIQRRGKEPPDLRIGEYDLRPFRVQDLVVQPFVVPHDLHPTMGFRFSLDGYGERGPVITLATDFGHVTEEIVKAFAGAKLIVVEANYEEVLLERSPRPLTQKLRISGPNGHLSNLQAAKLILEAIKRGGPPQSVLLAHLSGDHNAPDLAIQRVLDYLYLHCLRVPPVIVAPRDRESDWIVVS